MKEYQIFGISQTTTNGGYFTLQGIRFVYSYPEAQWLWQDKKRSAFLVPLPRFYE